MVRVPKGKDGVSPRTKAVMEPNACHKGVMSKFESGCLFNAKRESKILPVAYLSPFSSEIQSSGPAVGSKLTV